MLKLAEGLQKRSYENQVVFLICMLGILRVGLAVILDAISPAISFPEIFTDSCLLLLFIGLFLFVYFRPIVSSLHPVFGFVIVVLLGLNFMQFGGVTGGAEFNFYSGLFFIGMAYSGRSMFALMSFQLFLLIIMLWMYLTDHPLKAQLYIRDVTDYVDFIFSIIGISVIAYFLRDTTEREFKKVEVMSKKLHKNVRKSRTQNKELIKQEQLLTDAQRHLEDEIKNRTQEVETQNKAIEQFIQYNTHALASPQERLTNEIQAFEGDTTLHQLLKVSCNELNVVMDKIRETIIAKEDLDREKLKGQ